MSTVIAPADARSRGRRAPPRGASRCVDAGSGTGTADHARTPQVATAPGHHAQHAIGTRCCDRHRRAGTAQPCRCPENQPPVLVLDPELSLPSTPRHVRDVATNGGTRTVIVGQFSPGGDTQTGVPSLRCALAVEPEDRDPTGGQRWTIVVGQRHGWSRDASATRASTSADLRF